MAQHILVAGLRALIAHEGAYDLLIRRAEVAQNFLVAQAPTQQRLQPRIECREGGGQRMHQGAVQVPNYDI